LQELERSKSPYFQQIHKNRALEGPKEAYNEVRATLNKNSITSTPNMTDEEALKGRSARSSQLHDYNKILTPTDRPSEKFTPDERSFHSIPSYMVSPKPAKIATTYINKGEFELPQKL